MITTYDVFNILAKNHKMSCYKLGDTNTNRKTNEYIEVETIPFIRDKVTTITFTAAYRTMKANNDRFVEFYDKYNTAYFKVKVDGLIYEVNRLFITIDNVTIDEYQRNTYALTCEMSISKDTEVEE